MSQIRTAKAGDVGAFPGAQFVINGTPPNTQCQETQIIEVNVATTSGQPTVTKVGAFAGIDLADKQVIIVGSTVDDGIHQLIANTDDVLTTDHTFGTTEAIATAVIAEPGLGYLTRNESSFIRYIEHQGQAHTTKGGQLFTNLTDPPMDDACSDDFLPE